MTCTLRHWLSKEKLSASPECVEYIEPTPEGRRRALLRRGMLGVALTAAFVVTHLVMRHIKSLPGCDSIPWLRGIFVVLALLMAGLTAYGFRLCSQMFKHGQWPLPGTFVLARRRVQRGRWLCWRARGLFVISVLNACVTIMVGFLLAQSPIFASPMADSRCGRIEAARALQSTENVH